MRRIRHRLALFAPSVVALLGTLASVDCGARTGLPVDGATTASSSSTSGSVSASSGTAGTTSATGGGAGGAGGAAGAGGAPFDAGLDTGDDAPPDVTDAPPDVPDAPNIGDDCQDAGLTYIYLIAGDNQLLRFDPGSLTTTAIGKIGCVVAHPELNPTPYSMGVNRQGIANVVFTDGELFRVSTLTASCETTPFVVNQGGFSTEFGMGYSADVNDPGETLFIAGNMSMELATLDTTSFTVAPIGTFSTSIGEAELTGTGGGDLYAFGLVVANGATVALHLAQIDKPTASVLQDTFVTVQSGTLQIFDWAFAYWGGDFYFFTSTDGTNTIVSRYTPGGPLALPVVATIDHAIVGAGVSTCAPQQ
jgi:hypothetical protein